MGVMLRLFLALRFLMLFASLGAFAGGMLMFWLGAKKLLGALELAATADADAKAINVLVLGATDAFLFGIALFVIAYAIAFGFVLQVKGAARERLPGWMHVQGVSELKHTLIEVIIVFLIVEFATDLAAGEEPLTWQVLLKPASIVLIAAALRLMGSPHHPRDSQSDLP